MSTWSDEEGSGADISLQGTTVWNSGFGRGTRRPAREDSTMNDDRESRSFGSGQRSGEGRGRGVGRRGRGGSDYRSRNQEGGRWDRTDNSAANDSSQMEVSSRDVSAIIGRGGSKIRELEDVTGCRIKILRDTDNGQTTQVELSGPQEVQDLARSHIEQAISARDSSGFSSRDSRGETGRRFDRSDGSAVEMNVPASAVSRIIGKGGSKIRQLRDDSGANINIPRDQNSGPNALVEISGNSEAIERAKQLIDEIVAGLDSFQISERRDNSYASNNREIPQTSWPSATSTDMSAPSAPSFTSSHFDNSEENWDNEMDGKAVKNVSAGYSEQTNSHSASTKSSGGFDSWNNSNTRAPMNNNCSGNSGFGASNGSSRSSDDNWRSSSGFGGQSSHSGGGFGGFNNAPSRSTDDAGRSSGGFGGRSGGGANTLQMEVPSSEVARIIGRGGSKIRELQDESGARIKILRESGEGSMTSVELSGSEDAKQKAKSLIEELVGVNSSNGAVDMYENLQILAKRYQDTAPRKPKVNWSQLKEEAERYEAERWSELPPIKKNFYIEDPEVSSLHPDEVAAMRKANNNIMVMNMDEKKDMSIPNPVKNFDNAFQHYPEILREIHKAKFTQPSPIQMQGWPIALQGKDLIGIAQTGTGKTLAFLLPAFIHIEGQPVPRSEREGPTVLVLSPTRELALQIQSEVEKYSYKGIKCVCVYGGGNRREQVQKVERGVEIVVATPGRLNDLINAGILKLGSVTYLVLDEADRMLDMGFEPEIRKVLMDIRPDRHTIMTSATWPEGVRTMATRYMSNPIQVFVGSLDLAAVHSVRQVIDFVAEEDKRVRLLDFLQHELGPEDKVIVFVGRKVTADDVSSDFALSGVTCQCIHGDREQIDREQALKDLKEGHVRILIATDVASRGLDIKDITHVFNFDFPRNIEEYVHRVGRTGRAGRSGTAITLMTRNDWRQAKPLIEIMEEAGQAVPEELYEMAGRFEAHQARRQERRDTERQQGGPRSNFGMMDGGGGHSRGFGGRGGRGGRNRRDKEGCLIASFDDPFSF